MYKRLAYVQSGEETFGNTLGTSRSERRLLTHTADALL